MYKLVITALFLHLIMSCSAQAQVHKGIASYYADKFDGRFTASGEKYDHGKLTAAHKFLPFGTIVKVTNLANDENVEVKINDRGPFVEGRVIDLSRSAAEKLKFTSQGLTEVEIEVVDGGDGRSGSNKFLQMDRPTDNKTFFSIEAKKEDPDGWGVQVGSFQKFENTLSLTENLEKSYNEDVLIEVRDLQHKKVYAIIVGNYNSRKKADELKAYMAERFPGAFVVKF